MGMDYKMTGKQSEKRGYKLTRVTSNARKKNFLMNMPV